MVIVLVSVFVLQNIAGRLCTRQSGCSDAMNYRASPDAGQPAGQQQQQPAARCGDDGGMKKTTTTTARLAPFGGVVMSTGALS